MNGRVHITYTPRPATEATPLAAVYRSTHDSYAKKKAARPGGPDDGKEIKHVPATQKCSK